MYVIYICTIVDWILGCSLALRCGALNRCRFVVKDGLKYFPLYGFYLTQHGVLYIKRAGKFQENKAQKQLQNMVKANMPMWMVVFPEGTRFNPDLKNVIKSSQEFARQQGVKELDHVLYPRAKATQVCLQELRSYVTCVYDITFGYNKTWDPNTGNRLTAPGMPDFLSGCTSKVHVHISKISVKDIPSDEQGIKMWLYQRFQMKDELLKHFYSFEDQDKASFPGQGHQVSLGLMSTFPSALLFGVSFAVCMTFKEARSIYCKVGAVSLLAGLVWVSVRS
ncbi:hypothetical protein C0Q70_16565 [Pomacea canaliculata]|uniref:Phospholipid/glycerol acyltransferase domain-containing protein n=1 Tax=Pomacea canaliculata TaxID=400727 RepID=A0A2T7NQ48_POMCA|nr:hypothetical protein C0Q70_16565 [Pomacea canaliculata]